MTRSVLLLSCLLLLSCSTKTSPKNNAIIHRIQTLKAVKTDEVMVPVRVNGKWGYVDAKGDIIIEPQLEGAYFDKAGKIVIPAQFDWAGDFREGLALVNVGQEYGYIDKSGKYIWKPTR